MKLGSRNILLTLMLLPVLSTQAMNEQKIAAGLALTGAVTYVGWWNLVKKPKIEHQLTQVKAHIKAQEDEYLSHARQILELVKKFESEVPGGKRLVIEDNHLFFAWVNRECNKLDRVKADLKDNSDATLILDQIESHKALIYDINDKLANAQKQERELEYAQSSIISRIYNCLR